MRRYFEKYSMFLSKILNLRQLASEKCNVPPAGVGGAAGERNGSCRQDLSWRRRTQHRLVICPNFLADYVENFFVAAYALPVAGDVVADHAVKPVAVVVHGTVIVQAALL